MDKKSILAFLIGGGLVGGLVWMVSRPKPDAPPAEVVAEVREVPNESAASAASATPAESTRDSAPATHAAPSHRAAVAPKVAASKPIKPSRAVTPAEDRREGSVVIYRLLTPCVNPRQCKSPIPGPRLCSFLLRLRAQRVRKNRHPRRLPPKSVNRTR